MRSFCLKNSFSMRNDLKIFRCLQKGCHTYNEVNILMIHRSLQKTLFGDEIKTYPIANEEILKGFKDLGIDVFNKKIERNLTHFSIPNIYGNVQSHVDRIASDLTSPYIKLLESFPKHLPQFPSQWISTPGWTKYDEYGSHSVDVPTEDVLFFDIEVLLEEGDAPTFAVALTPNGWYSWTSSTLFSSKSNDTQIESFIPLYGLQDVKKTKCLIGHFGTGLRFVDTLALHVASSGLTSNQRYLKTTADKHLFNNKSWQSFLKDRPDSVNSSDGLDYKNSIMGIQWLHETSLNSLTDVYRLYCSKEPPQTKEKRSVFVSGTKKDVQSNFQSLMKYCATDVSMTFEIFQALWPLFKQRFPHPASLFGLLEMGSMYLPINDSWNTFQDQAEKAFTENEFRQKKLLMQLADNVLEKYANSDDDYKKDPWLWDLDWSKPKKKSKTEVDERLSILPKWYRDLIPKPINQNLDAGPALLTGQMRIAPKLLRLCWEGLPLHHDKVLQWGVLIPGRVPQPVGDPSYYKEIGSSEKDSTDSSLRCGNFQILSDITVTKTTASGEETLSFPYSAYLKYWLADMKKRLLIDIQSGDDVSQSLPLDNFVSAYHQRINPNKHDDFLLEEFSRSIEIMPLDNDERLRLIATISTIRDANKQTDLDKDEESVELYENSDIPVYKELGELQAKGGTFWTDSNRFDLKKATWNGVKSRKRQQIKHAVDTANPIIPTCWFKHLPHDSGDGLPVGSPLSRSFQVHISTHRLHSARDVGSAPDESMAISNHYNDLVDQLLQDRIYASFWQSYSKRIKSQIVIYLPHHLLPETVRNHKDYSHLKNYGAILPQVITSGTVSRRAVEHLWLTASNANRTRMGSEIKAIVQSPPGYCFVGADVDSQEMWIASLIGDSSLGFQGATPYGWMTLQGNKADRTDLHTKVADQMKIKRSESKVLNYARLYGSGYEFTRHLLAKFCSLSHDQASLKAKQLLQFTKGTRVLSKSNNVESKTVWKGGTESAVFNELEAIARSPDPCTPIFKAKMTRALNPKLVKNDFLPSRINWVVQSSAVDYLHCMIVVMAWLLKQFNIRARLCISIHDEVRYLCPREYANRVALALQISNLLTRAYFAYQLGMRDLPESIAFFSSVEIDTCLRKDPQDDCITPSNVDGLKMGYGIQEGESLTIEEILKRTGGSLE